MRGLRADFDEEERYFRAIRRAKNGCGSISRTDETA